MLKQRLTPCHEGGKPEYPPGSQTHPRLPLRNVLLKVLSDGRAVIIDLRYTCDVTVSRRHRMLPVDEGTRMTIIGVSNSSWWHNPPAELRVHREELYHFAWSAPVQQLAAELGLSSASLAKAPRQHDVPVPGPGYWSKVQAGKPVHRPALPARKPGQDSHLPIHGSLADRFRTEQSHPEDPNGPFASDEVPEHLGQLRLNMLKKIGKVTVPRKLDRPHRILQALLRRDDRRREAIANATYAGGHLTPVFDQPDQQRKLRIVNALMHALTPSGYPCSLWGEDEPSFRAKIGDHYVEVHIGYAGDASTAQSRHRDVAPLRSMKSLRIELHRDLPEGLPCCWDDDPVRLEAQLTEIAATIVTAGEARFRQRITERLEHKAQMEVRRKEEYQAAIAKRNKERLEALHRSAEMFRQAEDMRALIASLAAAIEQGRRNLDPLAFAEWSEWAEAEADRLDPVLSGQIEEHLLPSPVN